MEVDIREIQGNWTLGYSLAKHVLHSVCIGENEWGHPVFDTTRSEPGEALFQLKYRDDFSQVEPIAQQLYDSFSGYFGSSSLVIPMPASKVRARQPVTEIARSLAQKMSIPCYENLLVKSKATPQMKDIASRDDKVSTLVSAFTINDLLHTGLYDVLIVDDLFDTGSSLEAATTVLQQHDKIRKIYVAVISRKR
ncbi:ComF family protein [Shewanella yunxiaonensis]|uniref:ComF family protein n=1 Tax=Shewanella yunxiaonensis TaxID=2829809 RepID=A0ABX7YVZ7_9GAMM|nr:ComF family protein [Shewanella yunxiaonensis]QUN06820.1 ComF family protein [Shewanella yunxiaonensis]